MAASPIVLVHGAFADAHAFDLVAPLFRARGHDVVTFDLPGHGADATPVAQATFDAYMDATVAAVGRAGASPILVGHSMAGMVVSAVAERIPERLRGVVYAAAYLPQSGDTLQALAQGDPESLVGANMEFAPDWSTVTIRPDVIGAAIAGDLPDGVQRMIAANQRPEPLAPFQASVTLTPARFGSVRKAYIHTTQDRAVTPALQQRMVAGYPDLRTASLDAAHLPFVSQPDAFVAAVLSLAGSF